MKQLAEGLQHRHSLQTTHTKMHEPAIIHETGQEETMQPLHPTLAQAPYWHTISLVQLFNISDTYSEPAYSIYSSCHATRDDLRKVGQLASLYIWHACKWGWFLIYGTLNGWHILATVSGPSQLPWGWRIQSKTAFCVIPCLYWGLDIGFYRVISKINSRLWGKLNCMCPALARHCQRSPLIYTAGIMSLTESRTKKKKTHIRAGHMQIKPW